jgi:predicted GIY-YIG superfamily endonuclease
MNDENKIKEFICNNREHLLSVIRYLLNSLKVRLIFYKFVINNIVLVALEKFLKEICKEKNEEYVKKEKEKR